MLSHWIHPLSPDESAKYQGFGTETLGNSCIFNHEDLHEDRMIALIGWDAGAANLVRSQLYRFTDCTDRISLVDLGNFKKTTLDFAIPALHELLESGIPWALIGGAETIFDLHLMLYETREKPYNVATLDENPGFPSLIHQRRNLHIRELHLLGSQAHLNAGSIGRFPHPQKIQTTRLGKMRDDIAQVEPAMRNADLIHVNASVLRKAEAPAQCSVSSSGLFSEEACQVMRYAGFGNKQRSLTFSGWDPEGRDAATTANVFAQMLWYFLEGREKSGNQVVREEGKMTEYVVHLDISDSDLTFYKDEQYGTWWVRLVSADTSEMSDLIPCSYEDYQAACQNMLSDRIFRIVQQIQ